MKRPLVFLLLAAALAAMPALPPAAQALMIEVPLKATTTQAAEIVQGEVVSQTSDWDFGYRTIYTDVVIRVDETIKGDLPAGSTVTVRVEGGETEGIGMRVEHQPRFRTAEKVLLFLKDADTAPGVRTVQSLEQGKYTLFGESAWDYAGRRTPLAKLKTDLRYMIESTNETNER